MNEEELRKELTLGLANKIATVRTGRLVYLIKNTKDPDFMDIYNKFEEKYLTKHYDEYVNALLPNDRLKYEFRRDEVLKRYIDMYIVGKTL